MARGKAKGRKSKSKAMDGIQQNAQSSNQPDVKPPKSPAKKKNKKKTGVNAEQNNGTPALSASKKKKIRQTKNKEKKKREASLAAVMQKYIGKSMPRKRFCKVFLKGYSLTNDQLIGALESPLGPQLPVNQKFTGNASYEGLAEKVKAVLKAKNLNKRAKPKPIQNTKAAFDEFSGNLSNLLTDMKNEMNSMHRKSQSSKNSSVRKRTVPPWHVNQEPSTSTDALDDDLFEDRTPMSDDEDDGFFDLPKPATITKRYSRLSFRCEELRRYDPNDVPMSDCDQSGSEDEPEDFNKYFEKRIRTFEKQRRLEIVRNRPFGVQNPNKLDTKYLPTNKFRR